MTGYPDAALDARIELKLGGTWTDVTGFALPDGGSYGTVTSGQPDGAQYPNPASLPVTFDNEDGRFSPRNAAGPWFGLLRRNTPARVSVAGLDGTFLRLEEGDASYASCPDATGLHITGDLDIRLDVLVTNWRRCILAARWAAGNQSWVLEMNGDGTLELFWSTDGSNFPFAVSTVPLTATVRQCVRVTLAVATGTVTFWTGPAGGADGSTWTQLGSAVVTGATSVFAGTAPVTAGYLISGSGNPGMNGNLYELEVRAGIGGTVKAHPVFSAQAAGTASFADAQGNTWSMNGTAGITDRDYRLHGELASLVPSVAVSGGIARTAAAIAGPLRRLQQGSAPPLDSALKRGYTLLTGSQAPLAYWPCEDGTAAAQIASGISGGTAMAVSGAADFGADTSFACSAPIPAIGTSRWAGGVLPYANPAAPANMLQFLLDVPAAGTTNGAVVARMLTTGTVARLDLAYGTGGSWTLSGYDTGGTQLFTTGAVAFGINGTPCRISMALVKNGTGVDYHIDQQNAGGSQGGASGTLASATVGIVRQVIINPARADLSGVGCGHISVQSFYTSIADLASELNAWTGEAAASRFARLAGENGYAARILGAPAVSVPMGPQLPGTLWGLLTECQQADQGLIFEPREALALGYRTTASMCSQAAAAALSYASANLPGNLSAPDDDLDLVNDWTVSMPDGSSARAVLGDGSAMSVSPPDSGGANQYSSTATVNVASASQLDDAAGWRLGQSTADEARYRQVTADFGIPGAPVADLARVRPGDLITAASPPGVLQSGDIRQIATGATETLGPGRSITWDCVPASPFDVAIAGDPVYGRADTDGSRLYADITSSDTALTADSGGHIGWTTDPADLPFGISISGEQMTVTAIGAGRSLADVYMSAGNYGLSTAGAGALWQSWTGDQVKLTRWYMPGGFGSVTSDYSYSADLHAAVTAGVRLRLSFSPHFNPVSSTDLASITALLAALKADGADVQVTLWHEPQGQGLSAAQYLAAVAYYGPAIRQHYPLWTVLTFGDAHPDQGYYPDASQIDGIACDQYFSAGITTFPSSQLNNTAAFADANGLPLGIWECGISNGPNYLTGGGYNFTGGGGNWTGRANATVAQVAVGSDPFGVAGGALQITAAGAGDMLAGSGNPAQFATTMQACSPGDEIAVGFWSQAATTPRTVQAGVNFYNSAGTFISPSLFDTSTAAADNTSGWTSHYGKVTAPANAAFYFATAQILGCAAGEVHRIARAYTADSTSTGFTQAQGATFFTWIQQFMAARAAGGRQNGDVILFSGGVPGNSAATAILHSTDYRIGLWQALKTALDNTSGPQQLTVIRAVNGIAKAHAAREDIRLTRPAIAALT